MNRSISSEIQQLIRDRADIVDLIGSYIQLKHMGKTWKSTCPFHQEKTPSFVVNQERQGWKCFGCGKGGDIFRFVMDYENVDYPTAANLIAQRYNIRIPERYETPQHAAEAAKTATQKDRLYLIHEKLADWFQSQLLDFPDSPVAQYLISRQLDEQSLINFKIGAAPNSWDAGLLFLKKNGFTDNEIILSGVVTESEKYPGKIYDRFRNRLIFPIWNEQKRIVAFSARKIDENDPMGKYINSPETLIFKKSRILYGLSHAREMISKLKYVILCEGQLDVIAMHRAGFANSVAPQGTSFTEEQAIMLKRFTDTLYIALDSDNAGIKASIRVIEIAIPLGFKLKIIRFPGGKDPDELYKTQGLESIHKAVHDAINFMDFLLSVFSQNMDIKQPSDKAIIANQITKILALIENNIEQEIYIDTLAQKLQIPSTAIKTEILRIPQKKDAPIKNSLDSQKQTISSPPAYSAEENRIMIAEHLLLKLMLDYEIAVRKTIQFVPSEFISHTPIGNVINQIINLTINGDWCLRHQIIQNACIDSENSELSEFLVNEESHFEIEITSPQEMIVKRDKAIHDTIFVIIETHYQMTANQALTKWKESQDPEQQQEFRNLYYATQEKLCEIRKNGIPFN